MFNPGNMEKMMEQLGMDVDDIPAEKVVVETGDGRELVFESPDLKRMEVQGQEMFNLQGRYEEREPGEDTGESDVEMVMERTGASREEAEKALEENDDLTEAIMSLQ